MAKRRKETDEERQLRSKEEQRQREADTAEDASIDAMVRRSIKEHGA